MKLDLLSPCGSIFHNSLGMRWILEIRWRAKLLETISKSKSKSKVTITIIATIHV
jgi:hypothetical protein